MWTFSKIYNGEKMKLSTTTLFLTFILLIPALSNCMRRTTRSFNVGKIALGRNVATRSPLSQQLNVGAHVLTTRIPASRAAYSNTPSEIDIQMAKNEQKTEVAKIRFFEAVTKGQAEHEEQIKSLLSQISFEKDMRKMTERRLALEEEIREIQNNNAKRALAHQKEMRKLDEFSARFEGRLEGGIIGFSVTSILNFALMYLIS